MDQLLEASQAAEVAAIMTRKAKRQPFPSWARLKRQQR